MTDQQICKAQGELLHLGESYLTYLHSTRLYTELYLQYHKGEKTVQSTADMVGFKLPEQ